MFKGFKIFKGLEKWLSSFSGPKTDFWQLPVIHAARCSEGLTLGIRMYTPTQRHTYIALPKFKQIFTQTFSHEIFSIISIHSCNGY